MRLHQQIHEASPTPSDGPVELNHFHMAVPDDGYFWLEDATPVGPGPRLGPAAYMVIKAALEKPGSQVKAKGYFPLLDEPTLFCKFQKLTLGKDSILKFANQFGWIADICRVQSRPSRPLVGAVGLHTWQQEIRSMVLANFLLTCIQNDDRRTLRKYISWRPGAFGARIAVEMQELEIRPADPATSAFAPFCWFGELISAEEVAPLRALGLNHGDVLVPARLALLKLVNPRLRDHCHPHLMLNAHRSFVGHLTPANLLGCLWLQFHMTLTGQLKLRICTICKKEMDVSESRKTHKMHDSCSKRIPQQRWRAKRRSDRSKK
jgi:hypothetical protein